jgi:hypothetical protein
VFAVVCCRCSEFLISHDKPPDIEATNDIRTCNHEQIAIELCKYTDEHAYVAVRLVAIKGQQLMVSSNRPSIPFILLLQITITS